MVGFLSKKLKLSFVDDPGKLYTQRRRATQVKGLETLDSKTKVDGPSESPRASPPPSPKGDQPQPPPMGEQPQPEHKIELCTPGFVDLPIINLQDVGTPFKIKVTTIFMVQHSPFTGKEDPNCRSLSSSLAYIGMLERCAPPFHTRACPVLSSALARAAP
jgi:hypothetical protein